MRDAYALGHLIAVGAFLWSGLWRYLPACFAALCAMSVVAVTYNPESRGWISTVYLPVEGLAVALRLLASVELTALAAPRQYLGRLMLSLSLLSFAFAVAIWSLDAGGTVHTFVQVRRYIQVATFVWMTTSCLFFWMTGLWPGTLLYAHGAILLVLTGKQAAYSLLSMQGPWATLRQWQAADWPGLAISVACCLMWTGLAIWQRLAQRP